jgi:hypothetical protein
MSPIATPDLIAYIVLACVFLAGTLVIGWFLGLNDRDQQNACDKSELKTRLAIAEMKVQTTRNANRKLAMKAAIASSPLGVRRGG